MKRLIHLKEDYNMINIPDDLNLFIEQSIKKAKHLEKVHYYQKLGCVMIIILLVIVIVAIHFTNLHISR